MAVPRNRLSNARRNSRRAHHAKKPKCLSTCPSCGSVKLSHVMCPSCGSYNKRVVVKQEA